MATDSWHNKKVKMFGLGKTVNNEVLEQLSAVAKDPVALRSLANKLNINLESLKNDLTDEGQALKDTELERVVGGAAGYGGGIASLIQVFTTSGCDGGPCAF